MTDTPDTTPPEAPAPSYPETEPPLRLSSIPIMPAAPTYAGACRAEGPSADDFSKAQAAGQDLPMMIWLRGDEDLCSEFTLDAEAVMARLGIRRSRLTQISGKELRVGRMRKGRYISPVFRPADVDAYLNWTRASASHLKSSGLLQDAAEELMQQSERLSERLEAVPQELADAVGQRIARATYELTKLVHERIGSLATEFLNQNTLVMGSERRLQQKLRQQAEQIDSLRDVVESQQLRLQIMVREIGETAALARVMRGESKAFREQVLDLLTEEAVEEQTLPYPTAAKRPPGAAAARRIKAASKTAPVAHTTRHPGKARRQTRHRRIV